MTNISTADSVTHSDNRAGSPQKFYRAKLLKTALIYTGTFAASQNSGGFAIFVRTNNQATMVG